MLATWPSFAGENAEQAWFIFSLRIVPFSSSFRSALGCVRISSAALCVSRLSRPNGREAVGNSRIPLCRVVVAERKPVVAFVAREGWCGRGKAALQAPTWGGETGGEGAKFPGRAGGIAQRQKEALHHHHSQALCFQVGQCGRAESIGGGEWREDMCRRSDGRETLHPSTLLRFIIE